MVISRMGRLAEDLKRNSSAVLLAMRLAFRFEAEADFDIFRDEPETESDGLDLRTRILALTPFDQKQLATAGNGSWL